MMAALFLVKAIFSCHWGLGAAGPNPPPVDNRAFPAWTLVFADGCVKNFVRARGKALESSREQETPWQRDGRWSRYALQARM